MREDDLTAIEPWLSGIMDSLKPAQRLRLSRKIGQLLRKRNGARIRKNVDPDGEGMEPRKRKPAGRGRKGRMFRKIALAKNMKIMASADAVELSFVPSVASAAAVHHFGLVDRVERKRNSIRVRYAQRRLLGIPGNDRDMIVETVMEVLDDF